MNGAARWFFLWVFLIAVAGDLRGACLEQIYAFIWRHDIPKRVTSNRLFTIYHDLELTDFQATFVYQGLLAHGRTIPLESEFTPDCLRKMHETLPNEFIRYYRVETASNKQLIQFLDRIFPYFAQHIILRGGRYSFSIADDLDLLSVLASLYFRVSRDGREIETAECGTRSWYIWKHAQAFQKKGLIKEANILWIEPEMQPHGERGHLGYPNHYPWFHHVILEVETFEDLTYVIDTFLPPPLYSTAIVSRQDYAKCRFNQATGEVNVTVRPAPKTSFTWPITETQKAETFQKWMDRH